MTGRNVFTEGEKTCLQELIVKYKLHTMATSGPDSGSLSRKKVAWARLTEEFNSIETNNHRTEIQLKKCWDNIKSRRKQILRTEKRERMKTGGGKYDGGSQDSPSNYAAIDAVIDFAADAELQFAIDSDMNSENIAMHMDIEDDEAAAANIQSQEIAAILAPESERAGSRPPDSDATGSAIHLISTSQVELERTDSRHPVSTGRPVDTGSLDVDHSTVTPSRTETGRRRRSRCSDGNTSRLSDHGTSRTEVGTRNQIIREELEVRKQNYATAQIRDEELHKLRMKEQEWLVKAAEEKYNKARVERLHAEFLYEQARKDNN